MGHLRGQDSMAAAFFKSAGVHQMLGYVEVTWYGYMGWGCLDYFIEQPGRYTFNQAFLANHHALIHRLETCFPDYNNNKRKKSPIQQSRIARQLGLGKRDLHGLVFDRDIVAFYGDPAWQAKMANGKNNWNQKLSHKKKKFVFTINPTNGSNSYEPINTNGVQRGYRPFVEFFEKRIGKVQIISGSEYNPVITDTFILVPSPNPGHEAERIEIIFEEKK